MFLDRWLHKARKEQKCIVCLWQISVTLQINTQIRGHLPGESLCDQNCESFWGELQQGRCLVTFPQPTRPPLHHHLEKTETPELSFFDSFWHIFEPILCLGTDCISTLNIDRVRHGSATSCSFVVTTKKEASCLPKAPKMYTVFHMYFTLYLPLCGYVLQMPRLIGTLPSMKLQFFTFPTSNILNAPLMDGFCTQNRNAAVGIKAPSRGCRT